MDDYLFVTSEFCKRYGLGETIEPIHREREWNGKLFLREFLTLAFIIFALISSQIYCCCKDICVQIVTRYLLVWVYVI